MWDNSFRIALVQNIYQYIFQLTNDISTDFFDPQEIIAKGELLDSHVMFEAFDDFKINYAKLDDFLGSFLTDPSKTFPLSKAILFTFILEVRTFVINSKELDKLVKKYLRIGDKLISDNSVSTLHAVLNKLSKSDFKEIY